MSEYLASAGFVFWLGLLTSVSPCPLAANLAALSFISRRVEGRWVALLEGLAYVLGRIALYSLLALVLLKAAGAVPAVSFFLQRHINQVLGPLLVIAGLFLLGYIKLPFLSIAPPVSAESLSRRKGFSGAFVMGLVFALAFCPVSAALYFGSMLPLAFKNESFLLYPALYGLGSGLPIAAAGVLLAFGFKRASAIAGGAAAVEKKVKSLTGLVFILSGSYIALKYVFGLDLP